MKAAYIGILTPGSTSRMRAEHLRDLTPEWDWEWLDTDPPLTSTSRIWQSFAYRAQRGIAVSRVNSAVEKWLTNRTFDLAWVDKAIFLKPRTLQRLRNATQRLVHFTPDTAFHANRSRHFERTLGMFDLLVTTKSFEVAEYQRRIKRDTLLLTTQGYDARVHYPRNPDGVRRSEALFIGLAEPERERCLDVLLEAGIPVRLAGRGWNKFRRRWNGNANFHFEGEEVFGDAYATLLSKSWIGLGLLSKRFPELHTTRTFEIPACGAVLATESTSETTQYFSSSEVVFFNNYQQLAEKLAALLANDRTPELREIATAGRDRVVSDAREYKSILASILSDPRLGLEIVPVPNQ
jgi:spore maturation protein CgeB